MPKHVRDKILSLYQQLRDAHWELSNLEYTITPTEKRHLAAFHVGLTQQHNEVKAICAAISEREKDPLFIEKVKLEGKKFSWENHEERTDARRLKAKLDRMKRELVELEKQDGTRKELSEQLSIFGSSGGKGNSD